MSSIAPDPISHHTHNPVYIDPDVELASEKPLPLYCPPTHNSLTPQRTDPTLYPEGGLEAWLVILGSFCGATSCFGLMNSIGILSTELDKTLPYPPGTIGWIFSIYLFVSMAGGVICGPMFDRYGPRWMVAIGSILLSGGIVATSFCTEYWQYIIAFAFVTGSGTSLVFTPSFAAPGHWFLRRRGLATGIAATGGSVGGVFFPLILQYLTPKIGFPWSLRVLAFIITALSVVANVLIRTRLPPLPGATVLPDFNIFRQTPFALLTLACMLMELSLFVPITYVGSYALDNGMSTSLSYQLITLLNAGSFFGRVSAGFAADAVGRFNTLSFSLLTCLLCCAGLWLPAGGSAAIMITFVILFGFASGSNISLIPVCVGQLCRTEEYGRYYATLYTFVSIGPLIGVPIGGNILTSNGGKYWGLIIFTSVVYAGSLAMVIVARGWARGWGLKVIF